MSAPCASGIAARASHPSRRSPRTQPGTSCDPSVGGCGQPGSRATRLPGVDRMGKATAYPASGRSSQSRRRIRTLLGMVTIVVVACACAAPPDGTPTPTQASTLRTVSALAASPAGLPSTPLPPTATRNPVVAATPTANGIQRREAIPWTRVGPGWSVVCLLYTSRCV